MYCPLSVYCFLKHINAAFQDKNLTWMWVHVEMTVMVVAPWFYLSMANFLLNLASRQGHSYITILGEISNECNTDLVIQDVNKMVASLTKNISTRWLRGPYETKDKSYKSEVFYFIKKPASLETLFWKLPFHHSDISSHNFMRVPDWFWGQVFKEYIDITS